VVPALILGEALLGQSLQSGFAWRSTALVTALLLPLMTRRLQVRSAARRERLWVISLVLSVLPATARILLVSGSVLALVDLIVAIGLVGATSSLAAGIGNLASRSTADRVQRWACVGPLALSLALGLAASQFWPEALAARGSLWLLCGLSLAECLGHSNGFGRPSPADYGLAITIALLGLSAGFVPRAANPQTILTRQRNFYGVLSVADDRGAVPPERYLFHGLIVHGTEILDDETGRLRQKRREPTAYFARTTGIGQLLGGLSGRPKHVGIVGLGVATLAAYGDAGDRLRFYEIDPAVVECARRYFRYLNECPAHTEIIVGDGRLALEREPDQAFDVLIIDAFSGDAVPVHLLTREAVETYLRHLKPDGYLVFNISNTHLDLSPVMNGHARASGLNLQYVYTERDGATAKSLYAIVSRGVLPVFQSAPSAPVSDRQVPWTDQRHSIVPLIRWSRNPVVTES
jgi:hypothetical protein